MKRPQAQSAGVILLARKEKGTFCHPQASSSLRRKGENRERRVSRGVIAVNSLIWRASFQRLLLMVVVVANV